MIKEFDAIFFDAGGTLFYPHPSVGEIYSEVAARHGVKAEAQAIERLFHESWLRRDGMHRADSSVPDVQAADRRLSNRHQNAPWTEKDERLWWSEIVEEVLSEVGLPGDFKTFFEELYQTFASPHRWKLYDDTVEVLLELKKRGKKMAIISNWDSRLFQLCEGLGLSAYFEFVLASAVFGASKPSPRIFEEALRRFNVRPERAVHVGDSFQDDVKGALAVGMKAILIDRRPSPRNNLHSPLIQNLTEIIVSS